MSDDDILFEMVEAFISDVTSSQQICFCFDFIMFG